MEESHSSQAGTNGGLKRADSISSQVSHTAQDFIKQQLQLEADAREALPYQFDTCTKPLGPLRQSVFACLTCTPPPASPYQQFTPAGVCYSCSISCHGEHTLVEIFTKRNFVCDCGTTRFANSGTPCSLRINPTTGSKGDVKGEEAREGNEYNHNFKGLFCSCGQEYDPEIEKGTMFQCLGLGKLSDGGCGEDWWHPECILGLPHVKPATKEQAEKRLPFMDTVKEEAEDTTNDAVPNTEQRDNTEQHAVPNGEQQEPVDDAPLPEGFPAEDEFDHLICYKCVAAFPWIKPYAGTQGFLPAVSTDRSARAAGALNGTENGAGTTDVGKKRKADDDDDIGAQDLKRVKSDEVAGEVSNSQEATANNATSQANVSNVAEQTKAKHETLPAAPEGNISLFVKDDFRDHLCRCPDCFPRLKVHPQLLEEEEIYEPPVSESGADENGSVGGGSRHSGSILDLGEAALSGMDRVRAIEGVMAYNHVRDKVKAFLQPFAESGQAVGAEDIKAYFAKLRGDEQAIKEATVGASSSGETDHRREQGGY